MAKNSDIMVSLGADITELQSAMKKGAKSVGHFSSKAAPVLRDAANNIAKVGAAAAVTAAGGLLAMTKSATAAGRELKIFSQISNTSIQEFQNLSSAAAEFGITSEKLADQLKDVKDRVGDFLATGGGPMADFFDNIAPKVGVTAEQFKNLSGAQSLQLYISSLEKANLSQSEMTFYLEAMASDLTQLAPLFANNGKLISENEKRIRDMGLALSDIDVAQLEEGAKAFTKMKESSAAAANIIGAKLAPFIVAAQEKMDELSKSSGGFGDNVTSAISKVIKSFGFLGNVVQGLKVTFKGVELVIKGLATAALSAVEIIVTSFAYAGDKIIVETNNIIAALNTLPKVDIAFVDTISDGAFVTGLQNLGKAARENVVTTKDELAALAMQELPSDKIQEFLNGIIEKSEIAAASAAKVHNAMLGGGEDGEQQTPLEKEQEEYGMRLDAYNDFLMKKLDMQNKSNKSITGIMNSQWGNAAASTAGAMKSILGTMSTESKKAFDISKKWALADAVISTAQGIANGLKMSPWPVAVAATAWAAATGFAQITQIKNQKFGGAGGAAASGNGTPATAPNPVGVGGGAAQAQQGQTLTVAPIDPDAIFSGASMQSLANRLAEFSADGGTIITE